jgi:hypothetical protein
MNSLIKKELSEYLEFDCDILFEDKSNLIRIFGGAVRDIIANQKINDIDILCAPRSINFIEYTLKKNGYNLFKNLSIKDIQDMYSQINVISEPHTWIKGTKIVQIIRPRFSHININHSYRENFYDLIKNVDLSCCGVSYDGELREDFENAILHCLNKVFYINKNAKMYSYERSIRRKYKLEERGWKEIDNTLSENRELKLKLLLHENI